VPSICPLISIFLMHPIWVVERSIAPLSSIALSLGRMIGATSRRDFLGSQRYVSNKWRRSNARDSVSEAHDPPESRKIRARSPSNPGFGSARPISPKAFRYTIVRLLSAVYFTDVGAKERYLGYLNFLGIPWNVKFLCRRSSTPFRRSAAGSSSSSS